MLRIVSTCTMFKLFNLHTSLHVPEGVDDGATGFDTIGVDDVGTLTLDEEERVGMVGFEVTTGGTGVVEAGGTTTLVLLDGITGVDDTALVVLDGGISGEDTAMVLVKRGMVLDEMAREKLGGITVDETTAATVEETITGVELTGATGVLDTMTATDDVDGTATDDELGAIE